MAFVLPNGTVVDPEGADRDRILGAISERRRIVAQKQNSERQAQMQSELLAQEREAERASRDQEATLAREEMSQRERMAKSAESSLDTRLQKQFEREQEARRVENLAMTDEEESLATGIAKRINDQLAQLGNPPDPKKNPTGFEEWRTNWQRVRSQIPSNLENALIEENGKWRINSEYFKLKRARWNPAKSAVAAALSASSQPGPTDESIVRSMVSNPSLLNAGRSAPSPQVLPPQSGFVGPSLPPGFTQGGTAPSIAEALSQVSPQAPGIPSGMPASWFGPAAIQQPNPMGSARTQIMDALARLFLGAGQAGVGPMMLPQYQSGLPLSPSPSMQEIGDGLRLHGVTTWP